MITGIQPHRLQEVSSHTSLTLDLNFVELFADTGEARAAAPAGGIRSHGLAAGDMIGVALARGDVFQRR